MIRSTTGRGQYRERIARLSQIQEADLPAAQAELASADRALSGDRDVHRNRTLRQIALGGIPMVLVELHVIFLGRHALTTLDVLLLAGVVVLTWRSRSSPSA